MRLAERIAYTGLLGSATALLVAAVLAFAKEPLPNNRAVLAWTKSTNRRPAVTVSSTIWQSVTLQDVQSRLALLKTTDAMTLAVNSSALSILTSSGIGPQTLSVAVTENTALQAKQPTYTAIASPARSGAFIEVRSGQCLEQVTTETDTDIFSSADIVHKAMISFAERWPSLADFAAFSRTRNSSAVCASGDPDNPVITLYSD